MDEEAFGVKITLVIFFLASTKSTSGPAPRTSNILLFAHFSFSFISLSIFYFSTFPQPFLSLRFHISFIANARLWSLYHYSSSLFSHFLPFVYLFHRVVCRPLFVPRTNLGY